MAEKDERALRLLNVVPTLIMNFLFIVVTTGIYFKDGKMTALNFALQFYFTSVIVITLYKKYIVKELILNADRGRKRQFIRLIILASSGLMATIMIDLLRIIPDAPPMLLNILLWATLTLVGLFIVSTTSYTHYYYGQKLNTVKVEGDKVKAELDLLKSQINPHFLFNTLNNIYGLVHMKDNRAPEMISMLSKILRYLLYDCGEQRVSLRKEKELIENYLRLQAMKSKNLANRIDFYCDGLNDKHMIMPMLLINFVENCFKHSDIETNLKGWVNISMEVSDNELCFTARNTVKKDVKKKKDSGIGLTNTQRMLKAEYDQKHRLQSGMIDNFFEIDLKLELV